MPLSDAQLHDLEAVVRREAEQVLRDRGWDAHVVLIRNPFADELALRVQATATLHSQLSIPTIEVHSVGQANQTAEVFAAHLAQVTRQFPPLPGSPEAPPWNAEWHEERARTLRRLEAGLRTEALTPAPKKPPPIIPSKPERSRLDRLLADDLL